MQTYNYIVTNAWWKKTNRSHIWGTTTKFLEEVELGFQYMQTYAWSLDNSNRQYDVH